MTENAPVSHQAETLREQGRRTVLIARVTVLLSALVILTGIVGMNGIGHVAEATPVMVLLITAFCTGMLGLATAALALRQSHTGQRSLYEADEWVHHHDLPSAGQS